MFGLSVLTFDMRAHGESSRGGRASIGYHERTDLERYIEFLLDRGIIGGQIGVVGFSPDAVVTLMKASKESELAWIVLDVPYNDLGQVVCLKVSRTEFCPGS